MESAVLRLHSYLLVIGLFVLVQGTVTNDKKVRTLKQGEAGKKTIKPSQPLRHGPWGRRKNIWSYNPGHRSLAFLMAGEVETFTSNPMRGDPGEDYRCLGCCGAGEPGNVPTDSVFYVHEHDTCIGPCQTTRQGGERSGKHLTLPSLLAPEGFIEERKGGRFTTRSNGERRDQPLIMMEEVVVMEIESNSIIDLCLGCCNDYVTPLPKGEGHTRGGSTTVTARDGIKRPIARQSSQPAPKEKNNSNPCTQRHCSPVRNSDSDSSSEESIEEKASKPIWNYRMNRQHQQPNLQQRAQDLCRFLGCRSPLGSNVGSSSEEN